MEGKHFVYFLRIEGEKLPFYIGKASYKTRPYAHLTSARLGEKSLKASVIRKADRLGRKIYVKVVFRSNVEQEVFEEERRLILLYGRRDIDKDGVLTNMTEGGEGACGHSPTNETRAKKSEAMRGRKRSKEHCIAIAKGKRGHSVSESTRSKISSALRGQPISESTRQSLAKANIGRLISDETKEKISMAHKGRTVSSEQRAAISETLKGQERSERSVDLSSKTSRADAATHIIRWLGSNLSQKRYCAENKISQQTFCGWKRSPYVQEKVGQAGYSIPHRFIKKEPE